MPYVTHNRPGSGTAQNHLHRHLTPWSTGALALTSPDFGYRAAPLDGETPKTVLRGCLRRDGHEHAVRPRCDVHA